MKIAACYIVLNEGDYIKYSIESIYEHVEQIVIVHGCTEFTNMHNEHGLSIDNTKEQIEAVNDYQHKIRYTEVGKVPTKTHLRNHYVHYVRDHCPGIDWMLIVDGDEVYRQDELLKLRAFLQANPDLVHVFYPQHWFWGDFNHVAKIDHDKIEYTRPDLMFFDDRHGNTAYQGKYHERLYRAGLGFEHKHSHSTVCDKDGEDVYISSKYTKLREFYEKIHRYHYGYIESLELIRERFKYYTKRDGSSAESGHRMYLKYLKTGYVQHKYYSVVPFEGEHPEIMKRHKFYNKHVNDIK